jgi:hypothetical protein
VISSEYLRAYEAGALAAIDYIADEWPHLAEPKDDHPSVTFATAEFPDVSIQDILDGWTLEEVQNLSIDNSEAIDELACQAYEKIKNEPEDVWVSFSRTELEAYIGARTSAQITTQGPPNA